MGKVISLNIFKVYGLDAAQIPNDWALDAHEKFAAQEFAVNQAYPITTGQNAQIIHIDFKLKRKGA